jgi:hypothetical protein
MAQVQGAPQYLSFNTKISPGLASFQSPSAAELEDMQNKDPALKFTCVIWEQIMRRTMPRMRSIQMPHTKLHLSVL